ncbi:hypothetical protein H8N00_32110 [Streptomyces sp. AC563]|uniref:hypothetical protein n=1 Tax=Streptomyces buecherae TaxID=2763006 RepID=UPI00164EA7E6|nr:hypothetical protein [Streptomyces buecherae]MBC3993434.1 hypothetical protein [Streptomyces buecherae]
MTTSPHDIDATALGPDAAPHPRAPGPAPSAGAAPRRGRQPAPQAASAEAEIEQLASLTPLEPAALVVCAHASRTTSIGLPDLVRLTGRIERS